MAMILFFIMGSSFLLNRIFKARCGALPHDAGEREDGQKEVDGEHRQIGERQERVEQREAVVHGVFDLIGGQEQVLERDLRTEGVAQVSSSGSISCTMTPST